MLCVAGVLQVDKWHSILDSVDLPADGQRDAADKRGGGGEMNRGVGRDRQHNKAKEAQK